MATVVVRRPEELGPALRVERIAQQVTQSELAVDAGVGRQWLNAFELGDKRSAPFDMVLRVAAALDVTVRIEPYRSTLPPEPAVDLQALLDEVRAP